MTVLRLADSHHALHVLIIILYQQFHSIHKQYLPYAQISQSTLASGRIPGTAPPESECHKVDNYFEQETYS